MNNTPRSTSIFDRKSIRYPFIRLIVVATLIGIGLAFVSDAFLMLDNVRQDIRRTLTSAANAAGNSASAAVVFHDSVAAWEVLRMFEAYPEIKAAALYTNTGYRLARFGDDKQIPAQAVSPPNPEIGLLATSTSLQLPIMLDGTPIGSIYLKAQLDTYWHTYLTSIATKFLVGLGAGALVLLLSLRFLDRIVLPVRLLAEAANEARLKQDFSPRTIPAADDEIGDLVRNFNALLGEIDAGRKSIQTYQNELERLVETRTEALSQANRELLVANRVAEAASKAKSDFLANMSHEIRTPMNAIIGLTQLGLQTEVTPKLRNYLEKVLVSADWLLGVINDILDFSKIEAGKMELEHTDFFLKAVLENLSDVFREKANSKGLTLRFQVADDIPSALLGDALRLGQVLSNLVNNAIKFTEKGQITVGVQRFKDDERGIRLRFEVSDTDIGLSEEARRRLFTPFTQADSSTTRKFGGTGLGLSICKQLVQMMDGFIGVDSHPGVGSTFYFTARFDLPEAVASPPQILDNERLQEKIQAAAQALRGAHLLLVEDNAVNREVALEVLANAGIQADFASNGLEAVEMVKRTHYDAVLMDCQMPVMDGFDATRRIRDDIRFTHLPIIAMTANALEGDRERCIAAGMNDHIAKPLNIANFFATLTAWVKPHGIAAPATQRSASGNPPESTVPKLSGVDSDEAMKNVNDNVALYRKILASFRDDQADAIERIYAAHRGGDEKSTARLLHTLRGLAASIGAQALARNVRDIEAALHSGQRDLADTLLAQLEAPFAALIREIDLALPRDANHAGPSTLARPAPENLAPRLADLAALLFHGDTRALDQTHELEQLLRGSVMEQDARKLRKMVDRYAFAAALEFLRETAAKLALPLPPHLPEKTDAQGRHTVLVVDDAAENLALLSEALNAEYRVKVALDGETALRLTAAAVKPDLLLLDITMPHMSGYEVCQTLKDNPATQDIPVIFVTALDDAPDEEKGLRLGAVDYITKPVSPAVVQARVRSHIALKIKTDLLESKAFLDGLTNIPNRRRFDEALDAEWKRALRSRTPLAVIMVDVDHFKIYNDCYGHGAGDICLKTVASALAAEAATRAADLVARFGGEEFVVLLPETDARGAHLLAERLRTRIEAQQIPHEVSDVIPYVTISAGFASIFPSANNSSAQLLEIADQMLYRAKSNGRNCVMGKDIG